ncbi:MAG: glycosyltransferase family 2 protein [Candidatus Eisenbacteria bacterium]|nr:glycosyltransferase family 2 protein [Candidatus Eisenbacteria bacterium]
MCIRDRVIVRPWEGFAGSKRFAIARARHRWILWLDADERIDPDLAAACAAATAEPRGKAGFWMRRRSRYLGREIRHGNWGIDSVLRLFDRERARIDDRSVHEQVRVDGPTARLRGILWHESYRDVAHHFEKIGEWSRLWAEQARAEGRRTTALDLLFRPPLRFVKGYLVRGGFRDGRTGLVVAVMDALYAGMKYTALLEAEKRGAREKKGIASEGTESPEET